MTASITIALADKSNMTEELIWVEAAHLAPVEAFRELLDGGEEVVIIPMEVEDDSEMTAARTLLKWLKHEACLQDSIKSKDQFWAVAKLADKFQVRRLMDDLTV
jgi:hypothetical protein